MIFMITSFTISSTRWEGPVQNGKQGKWLSIREWLMEPLRSCLTNLRLVLNTKNCPSKRSIFRLEWTYQRNITPTPSSLSVSPLSSLRIRALAQLRGLFPLLEFWQIDFASKQEEEIRPKSLLPTFWAVVLSVEAVRVAQHWKPTSISHKKELFLKIRWDVPIPSHHVQTQKEETWTSFLPATTWALLLSAQLNATLLFRSVSELCHINWQTMSTK